MAPEAVASEIAEHLPELAAKRGIDLSLLFAALRTMPVEWRPDPDYAPFREEAMTRMADRDPDDWPVVALALTLDAPIWLQDKDLSVSGLLVYTTGDLLDLLEIG